MQPFKNIRVVDMTHVIAGPFCAYQLAVMGADVIKVEPPTYPDVTRATGNDFPAGEKGLGYYFTSQNANKRAISVDIKTEDGREIILDLCKSADVFIENFRSGAMQKIGLGYDDIKRIKPDIVYCSLTGFGQTGPLAKRTAYDNVIQAFSGLMSSNGRPETSPIKVGPPVLDYGSGMQAAYAIACALFQRQSSGEGQYIDVSMLDSALMLMSSNVTHYEQKHKLSTLTGNDSPFYPGYSCFDTADGKIMLGAYNQEQVKKLWKVLGDSQRGEEVGAMQPREMGKFKDQDVPRIGSIMKTKTALEWEEILNQAHIPAAKVRTLDETLSEEQVKSRGVLQSIESDSEQKSFPVAGFSYRKDGPRLSSSPPVFAQHTRAVLQEIGYNDPEINALIARGIVAADDTAKPD